VNAAGIAATVAGAACIALALRDIFDVLFHPRGRALLSAVMARVVRRPVPARGPVTLLLVIATWAVLLIVGWALVIWPHLEDSFRFPVAADRDFVDALYVSLVTLATLGFGEVTPSSDLMKLLLPLEALIGLGLLTASLAWLLSLYPALSRRRSLAYDISLLRRAEGQAGADLFDLDPDTAAAQIGELTSRLVAIERDMTVYPIADSFVESDERFSMTDAMPYLLELAERGMDPSLPPPTRLRALMLRQAVEDVTATCR
jgi:hypothetical protein